MKQIKVNYKMDHKPGFFEKLIVGLEKSRGMTRLYRLSDSQVMVYGKMLYIKSINFVRPTGTKLNGRKKQECLVWKGYYLEHSDGSLYSILVPKDGFISEEQYKKLQVKGHLVLQNHCKLYSNVYFDEIKKVIFENTFSKYKPKIEWHNLYRLKRAVLMDGPKKKKIRS